MVEPLHHRNGIHPHLPSNSTTDPTILLPVLHHFRAPRWGDDDIVVAQLHLLWLLLCIIHHLERTLEISISSCVYLRHAGAPPNPPSCNLYPNSHLYLTEKQPRSEIFLREARQSGEPTAPSTTHVSSPLLRSLRFTEQLAVVVPPSAAPRPRHLM